MAYHFGVKRVVNVDFCFLFDIMNKLVSEKTGVKTMRMLSIGTVLMVKFSGSHHGWSSQSGQWDANILTYTMTLCPGC
jgi:hypothetical protein